MRTVDPIRHAQRRDAILDAAATAFATKGFDPTTVKDICAAAGIGSGTLFHYFADKRAILHAIIGRDADRQTVALGGIDRSDPTQLLWDTVDLLTADLTDPFAGGMVACLLPQLMVDEQLASRMLAMDAETGTVLADAIRRLDTDVDPQVGATWIGQFVDGLYLRCGDDGFDVDRELSMLRLVIERFLGLAR
ncbi:TetR/AcrR family transcriptional regulator [Gordonia soli]|uniref:Putative TetR family transcriptional regulator n=1 Tax=Gordonia soli NBRC 108243 TaxID=1223545 RepID=M0QP72_9ACTN|nr:TetR/AcrR family transcriptional regulator [Gordonia soli]GAC69242.1 putative TetR family transcriptional regulator [Gordonia soli NBRC 108243]